MVLNIKTCLVRMALIPCSYVIKYSGYAGIMSYPRNIKTKEHAFLVERN